MSEDRKKKLIAYTDGACWPNPGPGAWAFVVLEYSFRPIQEWVIVQELSGTEPVTTNNRMEMMAVIRALEEYGPDLVGIYSDSKLVINTANQWRHSWRKREWIKGDGEPVKNLDLVKRLDVLLKKHPVILTWVKGHRGDTWNERADFLAQRSAQGVGEEESGAGQPVVTGGGPTSGPATAESGHPSRAPAVRSQGQVEL